MVAPGAEFQGRRPNKEYYIKQTVMYIRKEKEASRLNYEITHIPQSSHLLL